MIYLPSNGQWCFLNCISVKQLPKQLSCPIGWLLSQSHKSQVFVKAHSISQHQFPWQSKYANSSEDGICSQSEWSSVWPTIVSCPARQPLTKLGCPEPLVIESFPFVPRSLENLHVVYPQANFEECVLWGLQFLWACLKQKSMSTGSILVPCVLSVCVKGSSMLSFLRSRKSL